MWKSTLIFWLCVCVGVCVFLCVFVSTSQSVLVYDLSCFRSRLCLPYLAEWCWVLAAPAAEPEPTAHCLNGRGLIPLLKAHSSKHHFYKATHAHVALSGKSSHMVPKYSVLVMWSRGVRPWQEKLLQAPDLISNNYQYRVSLAVEGKELFVHTSSQQLFVAGILQWGKACPCALPCTNIPVCHVHYPPSSWQREEILYGKWSNWSLNVGNLRPSNSWKLEVIYQRSVSKWVFI